MPDIFSALEYFPACSVRARAQTIDCVHCGQSGGQMLIWDPMIGIGAQYETYWNVVLELEKTFTEIASIEQSNMFSTL